MNQTERNEKLKNRMKVLKAVRLLSIAPFIITLILALTGSFIGIESGLFGVYTTYYGWEAFMWIIAAVAIYYWWIYLAFIGVIVATSVVIWKGEKVLKEANSENEGSIYEPITARTKDRIAFIFGHHLGYHFGEEEKIQIKKFDSLEDLLPALDDFCSFIFGSSREIRFHEFRCFPYLEHTQYRSKDGAPSSMDASGSLLLYTEMDYWFLWVIKQFLRADIHQYGYWFIDMDWLKTHAIKNASQRSEDRLLSEMPAEYLFW